MVDHAEDARTTLSALTDVVRNTASVIKARPIMRPSDDLLTFGHIFQQHPKANGDANFGDYKRLACFGLPYGTAPEHSETDVLWISLGRNLALTVSRDSGVQAFTNSQLCVVEGSLLRTLPGATNQVGHYDLTVTAPPDLSSPPVALIMLTPLDADTVLRVLPVGKVIGRLPTSEEFEQYAIPVPVRVGQSLIMRYDMAHSGSSSPGLRLHSVLSHLPLSELHSFGFTQPLKCLPPTSSKALGKRKVSG